MISLKAYLDNPCKALSIPYWKAKSIRLPDTMRIVHETDFTEDYFIKYMDEKYFRLYHTLEQIDKIPIEEFEIVTAETVSGKMSSHSNAEYFYRGCHFTGQDVWHVLSEK